MQLKDRDIARIWDMYQAAQGIANTLRGVALEQYMISVDTQLVIERRLEILGEAANRISQTFKDSHPEIPWRRIISQRNFIIHEYDEIDHDRLWKLTVNHIPKLINDLRMILDNLPAEDKL